MKLYVSHTYQCPQCFCQMDTTTPAELLRAGFVRVKHPDDSYSEPCIHGGEVIHLFRNVEDFRGDFIEAVNETQRILAGAHGRTQAP